MYDVDFFTTIIWLLLLILTFNNSKNPQKLSKPAIVIQLIQQISPGLPTLSNFPHVFYNQQ